MPHVTRYGLISPAPTPTPMPPSECPYFFPSPARSHPRPRPEQLGHQRRPHLPQQQHHRISPSLSPTRPRFSPVAPEDRLGSFLTGTLQLTGILGTGAYGVVYSAVDVKTNSRYAVKCLSKFNPDGTPLDRRQVVFQTREIRLHYHASVHPNVVSMLKIIDNPDCIFVILEYCPEGDLFFNITERGQYVGKDELVRNVFLQILDAVEYCHSQGIYHRDLKPENILVLDNGKTVKLADFGLATSADRSEDYGCGSTFYMSPECLDHSSRRPYYMCAPNDVWSLGVILVNLTCGRNPWRQASFEDSTYRAYAKSRDFLKTILPLSDELNDILARVFHRNPEQRISLTELREKISACSHFTVKHEPSVSPLCIPKPGPMTPPASLDDATIDSTSRLNVRGFKADPMPFGVVPLSPAPSPRPLGANDDAAGMGGTGVDAHRLCDDQHATVPLSPSPSDSSMSDAASSSGSSSARSTASSCSSLDGDGYECDLVEDDVDDGMHVDVPEVKTPPPEAPAYQQAPIIYEDENTEAVASNGRMMAHLPLEYPVMPHYTGPMPGAPAPLPPPQQQQHLHQAHNHLQLVVPSSCCFPALAPMPLHSPSPLHHSCAPWGETFVKAFHHDPYHQSHQPQLYHPVPLYHQAFPFATWQIGCY